MMPSHSSVWMLAGCLGSYCYYYFIDIFRLGSSKQDPNESLCVVGRCPPARSNCRVLLGTIGLAAREVSTRRCQTLCIFAYNLYFFHRKFLFIQSATSRNMMNAKRMLPHLTTFIQQLHCAVAHSGQPIRHSNSFGCSMRTLLFCGRSRVAVVVAVDDDDFY